MTAVVLAFAGCGGTGTTVPGGAIAQSLVHGAPGSSGDLLYVAAEDDGITMLRYLNLKVVSTITAQEVDGYGCVDSVANVVYFQTNLSGSGQELTEYPIGSTQSVGSIIPPSGYYFAACSADETTGNVAVILRTRSKGVYVAIYSSGAGHPQKLRDSRLDSYNSVTYDKAGNLFVIGGIPSGRSAIAELRKGAHRFANIVSEGCVGNGRIQSDGKCLISEKTDYGAHITLYRLIISGSQAKVVVRRYSNAPPEWPGYKETGPFRLGLTA
jgi:hypothetical protein